MDFTSGVVNSPVHNLPDRKETFFGEFELQRNYIYEYLKDGFLFFSLVSLGGRPTSEAAARDCYSRTNAYLTREDASSQC